MELVSVVIPTYHRENAIKRALDGVIRQTYNNIEIWNILLNINFLNYEYFPWSPNKVKPNYLSFLDSHHLTRKIF